MCPFSHHFKFDDYRFIRSKVQSKDGPARGSAASHSLKFTSIFIKDLSFFSFKNCQMLKVVHLHLFTELHKSSSCVHKTDCFFQLIAGHWHLSRSSHLLLLECTFHFLWCFFLHFHWKKCKLIKKMFHLISRLFTRSFGLILTIFFISFQIFLFSNAYFSGFFCFNFF